MREPDLRNAGSPDDSDGWLDAEARRLLERYARGGASGPEVVRVQRLLATSREALAVLAALSEVVDLVAVFLVRAGDIGGNQRPTILEQDGVRIELWLDGGLGITVRLGPGTELAKPVDVVLQRDTSRLTTHLDGEGRGFVQMSVVDPDEVLVLELLKDPPAVYNWGDSETDASDTPGGISQGVAGDVEVGDGAPSSAPASQSSVTHGPRNRIPTSPSRPRSHSVAWLAMAATILAALGTLLWRALPDGGDPQNAAVVPPSDQSPSTLAPALSVRWPGAPTAVGTIVIRRGSLPRQFDFQEGAVTLGSPGTDPELRRLQERIASWQAATVIVRAETGWGSGAFVSGDGWVLTNYHVVESTAQAAALRGTAVTLDVLMAQFEDGRIRPSSPLKATVYRADPVHDLALLKLNGLPRDAAQLPFFKLAATVSPTEDCTAIGSQRNGRAWGAKACSVRQLFTVPDDLSQVAAGFADGDLGARGSASIIETDARISEGDSGGPLLDNEGDLIGVTYATPANRSAGSVGWHVGLTHVRAFLSHLPPRPEGVPFDVWTSGTGASTTTPALKDKDGDGRVDSLWYTFVSANASGQEVAEAMTVFVDLDQRTPPTPTVAWSKPFGLWGVDGGRFRFDVALSVRADGAVAVAYTDASGQVGEIRATADRANPGVVWTRDGNGVWTVATASAADAPLDLTRFDPVRRTRLSQVLTELLDGSANGRR